MVSRFFLICLSIALSAILIMSNGAFAEKKGDVFTYTSPTETNKDSGGNAYQSVPGASHGGTGGSSSGGSYGSGTGGGPLFIPDYTEGNSSREAATDRLKTVQNEVDRILEEGRREDCEIQETATQKKMNDLNERIAALKKSLEQGKGNFEDIGADKDKEYIEKKRNAIRKGNADLLEGIGTLVPMHEALSEEKAAKFISIMELVEQGRVNLEKTLELPEEDMIKGDKIYDTYLELNAELIALADFISTAKNFSDATGEGDIQGSFVDAYEQLSDDYVTLWERLKEITAMQKESELEIEKSIAKLEEALKKEARELEKVQDGICDEAEGTRKANEAAKKAKENNCKDTQCIYGKTYCKKDTGKSGEKELTKISNGCAGNSNSTLAGGSKSTNFSKNHGGQPTIGMGQGINTGARSFDHFNAAQTVASLELCKKNAGPGGCNCKGANGGKDAGKAVYGESPYFGASSGGDGAAYVQKRAEGVAECKKASEDDLLPYHVQASLRPVEGYYTTSYNDSQGHCTIGVGTLLHKGGCRGSQTWGEAKICNQFAVEAQKYLKMALHDAETLGIDDTSMVVALANVNYQTGGIKNFSSVRRALQNGDWNRAIYLVGQTKWACQTWLRVEQFQKAIYDYATKCAQGGIKPTSCGTAAGSLNTTKCTGAQARKSYHPTVCTGT